MPRIKAVQGTLRAAVSRTNRSVRDTRAWGPQAEQALDEAIMAGPPPLAGLLKARGQAIGPGNMVACLSMMAVRLVELHRVLKPTGSLFLHCDPTASHYSS
jgi:site-specific DNA-methyltransferase (adenine-specific)